MYLVKSDTTGILLKITIPVIARAIKNSLPAVYRSDHNIISRNHPANSPDLNPIEGIWNIIKERVKQQLHQIHDILELKAALRQEWKQIKQEMVQERIDEMPYRCGQVFRHPRVRVKTDRW